MGARGQPPFPVPHKQIVSRIPLSDVERIEAIATLQRVSFAAVLRKLVRKALISMEPQP